MPAVVLQLTRVGFLILLWLFIFAVVRTIRADMRQLAAQEPRSSKRTRRAATRSPPARPAHHGSWWSPPAICPAPASRCPRRPC